MITTLTEKAGMNYTARYSLPRLDAETAGHLDSWTAQP